MADAEIIGFGAGLPGPPTLHPDALHGVLGDIVEVIRPHTEACDAALLAHLLVEVGNFIGRGPYVMIESSRHSCALFVALVGETARSRKGTTAGRVRAVMAEVDHLGAWSDSCITSGFGSGEAVVDALDNGNRDDDRLLVDERELSGLLTIANREGSILSSVIRNGWDGQPLRRRLAKKGGVQIATGYHLSAVAHITRDELRRKLTSTEAANGFANRWLWTFVHRARRLPRGGALTVNALAAVCEPLDEIVHAAYSIGEVGMTADAWAAWDDLYDRIADGELPGIGGALTNRAEAYVRRLALLYAVLDGADVVDVEHLGAAWAFWQYCADSVAYLWADATGDEDLDRLVVAVRAAEPNGLSMSAASAMVFSGHRKVGKIAERGVALGLLRIEIVKTKGAPVKVLHLAMRG